MSKFGDKNFGRIMLAKVYCVHLVNDLGYDVLFQDVDVVPLRPDVLDYFDSINIKYNKEFDLYFQYEHDFSRRQAPFCANSGFYFIRSNKKTAYLLSMLVRMGDLILHKNSHQQIITYVMDEHMVAHGLRVKVLGGENEKDTSLLFPSK